MSLCGALKSCIILLSMTKRELEHRQRQEYKDRIRKIKESFGCHDCGEKNHIVLDFDHLRDKKYNISRMIHDGFSWRQIKKEIEKCEIVCANCHRIRTYQRLTSQTA